MRTFSADERLTSAELARALGVSRWAIQRAAQRGDLPFEGPPKGRSYWLGVEWREGEDLAAIIARREGGGVQLRADEQPAAAAADKLRADEQPAAAAADKLRADEQPAADALRADDDPVRFFAARTCARSLEPWLVSSLLEISKRAAGDDTQGRIAWISAAAPSLESALKEGRAALEAELIRQSAAATSIMMARRAGLLTFARMLVDGAGEYTARIVAVRAYDDAKVLTVELSGAGASLRVELLQSDYQAHGPRWRPILSLWLKARLKARLESELKGAELDAALEASAALIEAL